MRCLAICSQEMKTLRPQDRSIETITLDGVPVTVGLITLADPPFDRGAAENRQNVLVKVKAFSCNYRDKTLIFMGLSKLTPSAFYVLGSEFVGEVMGTGPEVSMLKVGDRVIGDNHFVGGNKNRANPSAGAPAVHDGVPTNHASKEYQIFHEKQVIKIPDLLPDEVAAAFSIGAQTTYSMIRKAKVEAGIHTLVTAAKSNTSLFIINALKKYGVDVYATSTSMRFEKELKELGVRELVLVGPEIDVFARHGRLKEIAVENEGMDCVFDPFSDLHLKKAISIMASQGRYLTCGVCEQYHGLIGKNVPYDGLSRVELMQLITKNLLIMGNCLGTTQDLEAALNDYAAGTLRVVVDSVFQGDQVGPFFERTYNSKDKFGKVVYRYD